MSVTGHGGGRQPEVIRFRGRNRTDAKRKALNFWYSNRDRLELSVKDFSERLVMDPDGRTIIFTNR